MYYSFVRRENHCRVVIRGKLKGDNNVKQRVINNKIHAVGTTR